MADPRFFDCAGPLTLGRIADVARGALSRGADPNRQMRDVAPLTTATADEVSFLDNKSYVDAFASSKAGACIVHPDFATRAPRGMDLILTEEPYRAYARVAQAFYPSEVPVSEIAPSASIDPSARLAEGCRVDGGVHIGPDVEIGARTHIGAGTVIAKGVVIGEDSRIGAHVTIQFARLGARAIIHPGVRIGQDGFGFAPARPPESPEHLKIPQLGRVIIGDDVEIGANTTIDRGTGPDTVIGSGCKIDNLVQIGHNVQMGNGCFVVSQVGISGSTKLGNYVVIGGQVGIAGHLRIGDGVRMAAQSGVMRDIAPGTTVAGSPAVVAKEFWRRVAYLGTLTKKKDKGSS